MSRCNKQYEAISTKQGSRPGCRGCHPGSTGTKSSSRERWPRCQMPTRGAVPRDFSLAGRMPGATWWWTVRSAIQSTVRQHMPSPLLVNTTIPRRNLTAIICFPVVTAGWTPINKAHSNKEPVIKCLWPIRCASQAPGQRAIM